MWIAMKTSDLVPFSGFREHGNELQCSVKDEEFVDELHYLVSQGGCLFY
jgi:hypothetical protein